MKEKDYKRTIAILKEKLHFRDNSIKELIEECFYFNKGFVRKHIMPMVDFDFIYSSNCCVDELVSLYYDIDLSKSKKFNRKDALLDLVCIYIVLNKQHNEIEHLKTELEAYKEQYNKNTSAFKLLKQQLAESESKLRVSNSSLASFQLEHNKLKKEFNEQEKLLSEVLANKSKLQFEFDQLKQQLEEKDKQILELQEQSIRDNQIYNEVFAEKEKEIDEVRSNHANLVADIAYKAVNVYTPESKKTGIPTFYKIHYSQLLKIEDMENLRNYAQDKISFAVEQLEKVKEFANNEKSHDFITEIVYLDELLKQIDNQIKAIKGDQND